MPATTEANWTVRKERVGATEQIVWWAIVDGEILRDRRGVGRRFKSEGAARDAAALDASLRSEG